MAETRKAYRVELNYHGTLEMQVVDCVITAKRVAVTPASYPALRGSMMYYEPNNWPTNGYAWTPEEAWEKFLSEKKKELDIQKHGVVYLEELIQRTEAEMAVQSSAVDKSAVV